MPHVDEGALHAYLDGALDAMEREGIDEHVAACAPCRERLEEVREVRARASALLGNLEPGPIHAPAFEELAARAARRDATGMTTPPSAAKSAGGGRARWLGPQSLAWAASIALAFALGWLASRGPALPPDLASAPSGREQNVAATRPEADDDLDALRSADEKTTAAAPETVGGLRQLGPTAPGPAGAVAPGAPPAESTTGTVAADEVAAPPLPRTAAAPAAGQGGATTAPAGQSTATSAPAGQGPPGTAGQAGAAGEVVAPLAYRTARRDERPATPDTPSAAEAGAAMAELERFVPNSAFADAEGGLIPVPIAALDAWLGAPPLQIAELTLLRAEVGPAAHLPGGVPGLAVARLVYASENGQEIVLVQQFLGALGDARQGSVAGRVAPLREESRARSELAATAPDDLPATSIDPDGLATYRWRDPRGYLLTLSGTIDPDVLRGLAERVR